MTTWSLAKLCYPISTELFFSSHFESLPLIVARASPGYFSGLLNSDDIDQIVTTLESDSSDVCLVSAERKIEISEYTRRGGSIDPASVFSLHAEGATIILNHLHRRHEPLADLCAALELEFSAPVQTNIYLTPPNAKGFKAHFDTHDVFILQLSGSKRWRLFDTPIELPLKAQGDEAVREQPGYPTRELDLLAGDTLYIPRGLVHDAVSREEASLHVTMGILNYTWLTLISEVIAYAAVRDPAFRRALPVGFAAAGFDVEIARSVLHGLLRRLADSTDIGAALDMFVEDFLDGRRSRLRGQMAQIQNLQGLTIDSVLARRPHLAYTVQEDDSAIHVRCYGKLISIPRSANACVRYILEHERFSAVDLPNDLDVAGKLVLLRRLVREGLLFVDWSNAKAPEPNKSK